MSTLRTRPMPNSAILRINSERDQILMSPTYQRRGEIWSLEKRQLLLDSILNDYDIPKLYFHLFSPEQKAKAGGDYEYAIIDGRQRIETIWRFVDGDIKISADFQYLVDPKVDIRGFTYSDIAAKYPRLKIRFDSFSLPIILVETDDIDLIEDMFSRLNEAVPLNAAEKRNALGGPMAKGIRDVASHKFFARHVQFSDRRFQHREVTARLLFLEFSQIHYQKIVDTKKPYLDGMVIDYKNGTFKDFDAILQRTTSVLDNMCNVFASDDPLLRSQGSVTVYYLLVRDASDEHKLANVTRPKLLQFVAAVQENRSAAEVDITRANFDLLEYDRMSQQGTNDAASIKERVRILREYLQF